MCELFAMSCSTQSTLNYSLFEFSKHGGVTHSNKSGWGIAYYNDRDALLIKEPEPAADSPWVDFISSQQLKSDCVIAHVRLATIGTPAFQNTHPFKRELGGRAHIFAHNGTLKGIHDQTKGMSFHHQPIGETDSELGFCLLMERMRDIWTGETAPDVDERIEVFRGFCHDMSKLGSANFLYSDGDLLLAHGHRRIYEENGTFSDARPPGLSIRNCLTCQEGEEDWQCEGLDIKLGDQKTVLLASVPLGSSGWHPLAESTVVAIHKGTVVAELSSQ